jgi:hypothetical protein
LCCPALLAACGNHSGEAEHDSGVGLKMFGFNPESCSGSSRKTVRNHPGIAFILHRIPHAALDVLIFTGGGTHDGLLGGRIEGGLVLGQ